MPQVSLLVLDMKVAWAGLEKRRPGLPYRQQYPLGVDTAKKLSSLPPPPPKTSCLPIDPPKPNLLAGLLMSGPAPQDRVDKAEEFEDKLRGDVGE